MENKETLEEYAKSNALKQLERFEPTRESFKLACKNACLRGAKWQQERSYSEEEVRLMIRELSTDLYEIHPLESLEEWFEQFKKK